MYDFGQTWQRFCTSSHQVSCLTRQSTGISSSCVTRQVLSIDDVDDDDDCNGEPDPDHYPAGNPVLGHSLTLSTCTLDCGTKWIRCKIRLPCGRVVWFCIEVLYSAVFLCAPTPLNPNTKLEVGDSFTGDCFTASLLSSSSSSASSSLAGDIVNFSLRNAWSHYGTARRKNSWVLDKDTGAVVHLTQFAHDASQAFVKAKRKYAGEI